MLAKRCARIGIQVACWLIATSCGTFPPGTTSQTDKGSSKASSISVSPSKETLHRLATPKKDGSSFPLVILPFTPIPDRFLTTPALESAEITAPTPPTPNPAPIRAIPRPTEEKTRPLAVESSQGKPLETLQQAAASKPHPAALQPAKPEVVVAPSPAQTVPSLLPDLPQASGNVSPQNITAHAGEDVFVQFAKSNWVYLDPAAQQQSVGFLESRREKVGTSFLFRPKTPGDWNLSFQRQDLTTGEGENRLVHLTVLPPDTRTSQAMGDTTFQSAPSADSTPSESAATLTNEGKVPEAVKTLLKNYQADDSHTNWQIGSLLAQNGQPEEALSYLRRNLTKASAELPASLELATKLAAEAPQRGLETILPSWSEHALIPPEGLFLDALSALSSAHQVRSGLDWAGHYENWYPIPTSRDRFLYLKASLLEEPTADRDLTAAWNIYRTVVSDYPLSSYWSAAGRRAAALSRQILDVR